ncbi:MAG: MucB/RseB C-terminal domain-containing protein, partial [Burkholderiaceae bacterium]
SAWGQVAAPAAAASAAASGEMGIGEWLTRMHDASRQRTYIGTFVVSAGASMSSAKIWHVCTGDLQMERVESLSGQPRSTFRRNDQVVTFLPSSRVAVAETRESLGLFPDLLRATDASLGQYYSVRRHGVERVAGLDADVVQLQPKDKLRFGYRIWSEKETGMVIKLQTLDVDGRVLEQAAFSEIQMNAPVSVAKLTQMMENTDGYRVDKPEMLKTSAAAEGWAMKNPVPGFKPMGCHKRPSPAADGHSPGGAMQWVFSDGLASVSIFVEAFDPRRHVQEGSTALGATQTLTQRLKEKSGDWWLTVIGEVPHSTLTAFALGLERTR